MGLLKALKKLLSFIEFLAFVALIALLIWGFKTGRLWKWIDFIKTLPLPVLVMASVVGLIGLAMFMR